MTKTYLITLLKVVVSVALIWVALEDVDLTSAVDRASQIDGLMLGLAVLVLLLQSVIGGIRWRSVTTSIGCGLNFVRAVRLFYIGTFFNQVLPGGAGGDAVRIYLVYKGGATLRGSINGVMLERLIAVTALVLIVVFMQSFFPLTSERGELIWLNTFSYGAFLLLFIGLLFLHRQFYTPCSFHD